MGEDHGDPSFIWMDGKREARDYMGELSSGRPGQRHCLAAKGVSPSPPAEKAE